MGTVESASVRDERFQCAEAIVELRGDRVYKRRIEKRYRVRALDLRLRRERTKSEAKLLSEARRRGVPTPIVLDVDVDDSVLVLERLEGALAREVITEALSERIGELVGVLHQSGVIHGDLTTSNLIAGKDGRMYFIDFGLAFVDSSTEARGVDVHVFFQSLAGTHESYEQLKAAFSQGYQRTFPQARQVLTRVEEIERRGRYVDR
jgi:TP53 regulating kinase-like protein